MLPHHVMFKAKLGGRLILMDWLKYKKFKYCLRMTSQETVLGVLKCGLMIKNVLRCLINCWMVIGLILRAQLVACLVKKLQLRKMVISSFAESEFLEVMILQLMRVN